MGVRVARGVRESWWGGGIIRAVLLGNNSIFVGPRVACLVVTVEQAEGDRRKVTLEQTERMECLE